MGRAREGTDGQPYRTVIGAVHDKGFLPTFRMPVERAVGETLAILLIDDVHDSTGRPDAKRAHRDRQFGGDTGNHEFGSVRAERDLGRVVSTRRLHRCALVIEDHGGVSQVSDGVRGFGDVNDESAVALDSPRHRGRPGVVPASGTVPDAHALLERAVAGRRVLHEVGGLRAPDRRIRDRTLPPLVAVHLNLLYYFFFSTSPESAAMNASCGTSTRPTIFMRFLPSFCFSSSLRLRVMSPP